MPDLTPMQQALLRAQQQGLTPMQQANLDPLGQQPVQKAVTGAAGGVLSPVLDAGQYLGGLMQGSQQLNGPDLVRLAGNLAMMAAGPRVPEGAAAAAAEGLPGALGRTLRLFHGSSAEDLQNLLPGSARGGQLGAVHMTDRPSYAQQYGSNIYGADVQIGRIKEGKDLRDTYNLSPDDVKQLRALGYDAVRRPLPGGRGYEYAILDPDKISNLKRITDD